MVSLKNSTINDKNFIKEGIRSVANETTVVFDPKTDRVVTTDQLQLYTQTLKDSELIISENRPVPQTIGGLDAGTILIDEALVDVVHTIIYKYAPPVSVLHIEPHGGLYETNTMITINKWIATFTKGSADIVSAVIQTDSGITITALDAEQLASINSTLNSVSIQGNVNINVTKDLHLVMTVKDSEGKTYVVSSESIRFIDPTFTGTIPRVQTEITSDVILKLEKNIIEPGGTFSHEYTFTDSKIVLAYPEEWGELIDIVDQNKLNCTDIFETGLCDVVSGNNTTKSYRYYVLKEPVGATAFTMHYIFASLDI